MSILKVTDFSGEYTIPQNAFTNLIPFIVKYEKEYLVKILGAELYALFIADLNSNFVPQSPIYLSIFNAISADVNNEIMYSEGIKEMLKQFTYYHYMLENAYQKTQSGVMMAQSENNSNLGYQGFNLIDFYNKGVENSQVIQRYIFEHSEDYPKFNGIMLQPTSGI